MTAAPTIISAEKAAIRSEKIALRRRIGAAGARAAANSAAEHAIALLHGVRGLRGRIVSFYMPIQGEIDPGPLAEKLRAAGAILALPHVRTGDQPMVFREWRADDPLHKGYGGIREPDPAAPELVPEVVIVPLAAFDRRGFRIGYGRGHFDRTLGPLERERRPLTIGYAFALQ